MALQGVEENTLHLGAGHVPGTPLPGGDGNSAIAAHRIRFFRKLRRVRAGGPRSILDCTRNFRVPRTFDGDC